MRKLKSKSPSPPSTDQNDFLLRPLRKVYFQQPVTVSFTPQIPSLESQDKNQETKSVSKDEKSQLQSGTPRFNADRRHYTPCFVLPCISEEDSLMLSSHEIRLRESQHQINQGDILVPKPRKRASSYCSVCRCSYEDYLEHIQSQSHKRSSRETLFSKYIEDLARQIKQMGNEHSESMGVVTRSAKRRMKFDDPEVIEIMFKPRKRRGIIVRQNCKSQSKIGRREQIDKKEQEAHDKDLRQTQSTILKCEQGCFE